MNFYQVNQNMSFEREFKNGYLCCPNARYAGWPLMKKLEKGDILFHYNSTCGEVLGISRVIEIGQHKGTSLKSERIRGTQCIEYSGEHLSEDDLSLEQREKNQVYATYLEVHTVPLLRGNWRKLLLRSPQVYLVQIDNEKALRFIEERKIRLDDLK